MKLISVGMLLLFATIAYAELPVLVVLLRLVAVKGQVLYGIALLFCYATGHYPVNRRSSAQNIHDEAQ